MAETCGICHLVHPPGPTLYTERKKLAKKWLVVRKNRELFAIFSHKEKA